MKLASVLTDKRVLYLISAIAAYCFIGSIAVGNTKKAEAMVVGGIMIRAVSSNMIYVLLASIIAGLLVSYFLPMKEGMVDDDSASITVDANSIQEAVAKVKRVNQKKNERKEEKERARRLPALLMKTKTRLMSHSLTQRAMQQRLRISPNSSVLKRLVQWPKTHMPSSNNRNHSSKLWMMLSH